MESALASERKQDPEQIRYMDRYVNLLKLVSMWPRENIGFVRYWLVFWVILITNVIIIGGMWDRILIHPKNIDGIAEVVDFATVFTSGLFRYWYGYAFGRRHRAIVDFLHAHFSYASFSPRNRIDMGKHIRVSRLITNFYLISCQIWIIQMSYGPVVHYFVERWQTYENGTLVNPDVQLKMAVDIAMPFDTSTDAARRFSYVIHFVSYYTMTVLYTFMDAFWFAALILTTGQFELISHSLRNIRWPDEERKKVGHGEGELVKEVKDEEEDMGDEDYEDVDQVLRDCVKAHQRTRELVRMTEDLMNPIIIVDFIHAVASISFILLDTTIALNHRAWVKIANLLEYFFVSIFHMFVLNYFGNELSLKEQDISTAVYEIPWYRYPVKLKNKIVIMVTLARNPCRLSGGKLYKLCLEFFAATIKTIFSYFMVLLQFYEA